MKHLVGVAVALLASTAYPAWSQAVQAIPTVDPYVAVPNGQFLADNAHVYRVVFEARQGADKPDQLTPAVNMAGTEVNTMAAHAVDRQNVRFVVVFHTQPSDEAVMNNSWYRAKYGIDNPNLPVLAALKTQGVELYVCGQELQADGMPLDAVTPDVTVAEDGLVVLMTYGADGYAQLTF